MQLGILRWTILQHGWKWWIVELHNLKQKRNNQRDSLNTIPINRRIGEFLRIIEWKFLKLSVVNCVDQLLNAQRIKVHNSRAEGSIQCFLLVTQK